MKTALIILAPLLLFVGTAAAVLTPLDEYVSKDDGVFNVENLEKSGKGNGYTYYNYNVTTLKWLAPQDTNRHIWSHNLVVIVPDDLDETIDSALVYLTGGDTKTNGDVPSPTDDDFIAAAILAVQARSIAGVMYQIPNEPIIVAGDPFTPGRGRGEDAIIALTWYQFLHRPSQPERIVEFPMTKAAVKGLDALEVIIPQLTRGAVHINKFIVAGASKRGWTSWLTGAVLAAAKPGRVIGIIPIVLDALHVQAFFDRQWGYYGAWSFALKDYLECNITAEMKTNPNFKTLFDYVDMYNYRHRLTMAKLAVSAGGDEFQMPDDSRYWGHAMPADMSFLLVKNAEHSMATGLPILVPAVGAWLASVQRKAARPAIEWSIDDTTGAITFTADTPVLSADIAFADSAKGVSTGRRDFRWAALNVSFCPVKVFGACVRPVLWETIKQEAAMKAGYLVQHDEKSFTATMPLPKDKATWRVFTVEVRFANPSRPKLPFYMTVPASVIPNTKPFPPCQGAECKGTLV